MTPESQTCATGIHQSSLSRRSLNSSESLWDEVEWRNRFALHLSRLLYKFTLFVQNKPNFCRFWAKNSCSEEKQSQFKPNQTQFFTLFCTVFYCRYSLYLQGLTQFYGLFRPISLPIKFGKFHLPDVLAMWITC